MGVKRKWKICAVCGYPLEDLISPAGEEWGHARPSEWGDHIAVPVDVGEVDLNQRCDFCDAEPVTWIILAEPFDMLFPGLAQRSIGHWAVCETCVRSVQSGSCGQIVTRVKQNNRDIPRRVFVQMYEDLRRHMIAVIPRREWLPEEALVDEDECSGDQRG